mgnify:CR=1 FL=1
MNPIIILHAGLATGTILLFAGIGAPCKGNKKITKHEEADGYVFPNG